MRVALVHDWLTGMRGGEKVLRSMCGLYPDADLFTLIHVPGSVDPVIEDRRIITSWLDRLPGARRGYRYLLGLMPGAIERLDLSGYDLILSSSHCVAKGVIKPPGALHVCYCHTPMRYIWSQDSAYRRTMGLSGLALRVFRGRLRRWDLRSTDRVDAFIANSRNVAARIQDTYGRSADVVYPPIETDFYTPADVEREDFHLMVTAMAPYKRVDQAIAAFARTGRRLVIIGDGQQRRKLGKLAPANVEFLGWCDGETVRDHYRRCRAFIFPGQEDFGMTPLEAMACGAPVIAYAAGGALETVLDVDGDDPAGPTGLHYAPQTVDALVSAVERLQERRDKFDRERLVLWARRFGQERFAAELERTIKGLLERRQSK